MANRSLGTLTLDLVLKLGGFTQGWDKAARDSDKRMSQIEARAKAFGKSLGTALGVGIGAAAVGLGIYIKNSIEAEKVQAQLLARIRDTGGAANRSLQQLNAQAEKLASQTIFDDESIGEAQAMLLTFKQIEGVNFDRTIEASLDLATVMGTDATSAAKLLGKALNDPERGLTALTKAGVTFTDAERDRIDTMLESGRVTDAQTAILDKLAGTMGTAAEAARNTLGGAIQGLKNDFDNLLEGDAGSGGLKATTDAINELSKVVNDPNIKKGIDTIASAITGLVADSIQGVAALADLIAKQRELAALGDGSLSRGDATIDALNARLGEVTQLRNMTKDQRTSFLGFDIDSLKKERAAALTALDNERLALQREIAKRIQGDRWGDVTAQVLRAPVKTGDIDGGKATGTGSRSGRDRDDVAEQERRRVEQMIAEAARAKDAFDALAATLSGPLAEAEHQHQQNLAEITTLGKQAERSTEEIGRLKEQETERYEKQTKVLREQLDPVGQLLKSLEEEGKLLTMNNVEREIAIQLRGLEAEATAEQIAQIREANQQLAAEYEKADFLDGWRDAFGDFFEDVMEDNKSLKDSFRDLFEDIGNQIRRRISQQLVDQLFGQMGSTNTGAAGGGEGGWLNALASIFSSYGGARASGGNVLPGKFYQVNENGPELFRVGNKDYLLAGDQGGTVVPNHMLAGGGGAMTVIQNFPNAVLADRRSDSQRQIDAGRQLQRAQRNK